MKHSKNIVKHHETLVIQCDDTGVRCGDVGAWHGDRAEVIRCDDVGARCGGVGARCGDVGGRCGDVGDRAELPAISARSFGDIGDCGVGITLQMCNRVTNHGDIGTFSKPAGIYGLYLICR